MEVSGKAVALGIEGSTVEIVVRRLCGRLIGTAVVRLRAAGRGNWFRASLDGDGIGPLRALADRWS